MSIFFFTYEIVFILFHKDIVWEDGITDVQKKILRPWHEIPHKHKPLLFKIVLFVD